MKMAMSGNVGSGRRAIIRLLVMAMLWIAQPTYALEVFLNTNSPATVSRGSEFFDEDKWKEAAKAVDGIWYVGQGMTKPPEGKSIQSARQKFIRGLKGKHWIVELQGRVITAMANGTHGTVYEIKAMKQAGIEGFSAMIYREDRDKDSTLTAADVALARAGMKAAEVPNTPIILNTRSFHRNKLLQELVEKGLVDGFSMEFASNHVREGAIIESEIIPAIQFAVKSRKTVYLLLTAQHSKNMLEDVQDIFRRLHRGIPREMSLPSVRIVLSAYDGKIQFTPDLDAQHRFANTTSGAALWLCTEADNLKLREHGHGAN